jgi:hypothetical protein
MTGTQKASAIAEALSVLSNFERILRRFPERLSFADVTDAFEPSRRKTANADFQNVAATNLYVLPEGIHCLNERVALDHAFLAQRGVAKRETEFGHVASCWTIIPRRSCRVASRRVWHLSP